MTATDTHYWVGASGSWSNPANWSHTVGGAGGAGVPGPENTARVEPISSGAAWTITVDVDATVANGTVVDTADRPIVFAGTGKKLTILDLLDLTDSFTLLRVSFAGTLVVRAKRFRVAVAGHDLLSLAAGVRFYIGPDPIPPTPVIADSAEATLDELIAIMREDRVIAGFAREGAFYRDIDESKPLPNVVVMPGGTGSRIEKRGPGWQKERLEVHVLFRDKQTGPTQTDKLSKLAERLREVLEANPRLRDRTGVQYAKFTGWKPLYGRGADYIIDVADCTVDLVIVRRV